MQEYKTKEDHKSILVIVVGFLILEWIFDSKYLGYIALGVGIASLLSHHISYVIVFVWYKIAEILGWINSRIILTLLYFVVLTPIAFIYKQFNKNPLNLKRMETESCFVERNKKYVSEDFENMW